MRSFDSPCSSLEQQVGGLSPYRYYLALPTPPSEPSGPPTTMYSTSHLFFFGDLNFRLIIPPEHALFSSSSNSATVTKAAPSYEIWKALSTDPGREQLKEYDQLYGEIRKGTTAQGLREGEFWRFKCTYKYKTRRGGPIQVRFIL